MTQQKKLIVIGGGAAGFFCAVNAARLNPKLQVSIIERTGEVLQKVRVSGGGRCNVTHSCFEIDQMASCYPRGERFVRKLFYQFFTTDTIEWFKSRGVELKTEEDGRMFPKANTSQAIIDCLLDEMKKYRVYLQLERHVTKIERTESGFVIHFKNNEKEFSDYAMIACGGFWKLSQFDWLKNLNLKIASPVPSLFTFNFPNHAITKLMGVAANNVSIRIAGIKKIIKGNVLITHWGLSGPAVLKLSAFAARDLADLNYEYKVIINWCADFNENTFSQKLLEQKEILYSKKIVNGNFTGLPARLWEFLIEQSGIETEKRFSDLSKAIINQLAKNICTFEIFAKGKSTYKDEFVSAGGIDLSEIDANTMMCKKHNGLFFGGEVMDVDGITGGYNFQHAWTSSFIAAKHIVALSSL